jgi:rhamnose transport system permease protein
MAATTTAPVPESPSSAPDRPGRQRTGRLAGLLKARELPVAIALVVLVVGTYLINDRFLSPQSIKDLMLNATIMIILAVGQTVVLITRNVDLSVGAILGMVAFGTGSMFNAAPDAPIVLVILAGVVFGALLGGFNGLLVATARVPALVITLGMMYVYRGVLSSWAGSKQYFSGNNPAGFNDLSTNTVLGVPIITIIALVVVAAMAVYLGYRRSGRELYALGSDPDAASLFGIRVRRRVLIAFALSGALAGLAGVLYASRYNSVGALTGSGLELDVIAAAVVGGVAIFGGVGTVAGAAIGAVLLSTITSSLTATRVDKFWQQAIVGVLILAAVVFDRVTAIRRENKLRVTEARDD